MFLPFGLSPWETTACLVPGSPFLDKLNGLTSSSSLILSIKKLLGLKICRTYKTGLKKLKILVWIGIVEGKLYSIILIQHNNRITKYFLNKETSNQIFWKIQLYVRQMLKHIFRYFKWYHCWIMHFISQPKSFSVKARSKDALLVKISILQPIWNF